ncbi:MAG: asparaginase domain-containing protein [Planctomycetota bacterium]
MKIKFVTTGGTIDKLYFDARSEYQVGPPQVLEVLRDAAVTFEFEAESVLKKDSLDMTEEDRRIIRARVESDPCPRIVVTHGTDTMLETARALRGIPGKTVVLTGAIQPAIFRVTDAVFNIGMAVAAVQILPPGVYVAMSGRIFDPDRARKNYERNVFEEAS